MKKITSLFLMFLYIFCAKANAITVIKRDGTIYESNKKIIQCGQKYNAQNGKWETVPSNWQSKYNPQNGTWSYQPEGAKTTYNYHESTWDWDSGHN